MCNLPQRIVAFASRRQGAALTHKIKRSHCYFFPAVVIGCECTSIRDCTAPNVAIHSMARRAAMAKKRKTKAAAKKTVKKVKRKKKK